MNWQTFSQVAFTLRVTPELMVGRIAYAVIMGFLRKEGFEGKKPTLRVD